MVENGRACCNAPVGKKEHLQFEIYFIPALPGT